MLGLSAAPKVAAMVLFARVLSQAFPHDIPQWSQVVTAIALISVTVGALGGLVQKAGLVELTEDDRSTLLGGMLALADMLSGEGGAALAEVWRRRGKRAFELEAEKPSS